MTTITYTGNGNVADWSDGRNWRGGVAPGGTDTALLLGGANSTVTAPVTVNNLMILSTQTITFSGAVLTYGLGACNGLMVCAGATAVFAPGSSLADGGVLQIGVRSVGTLVATGTAAHATSLQAERTELGRMAAGSGSMTIDGASLTNQDGMTVGEAGHGSLAITDGGHVSADHLTVGLQAGSSGSIAISGASTLATSGNTVVGGKGIGSMTVGAGATAHAGRAFVVGSEGSVVLSGGTVRFGDTTGWAAIASGGSLKGAGVLQTTGDGGVAVDGRLEASGGTLEIGSRVTGSGALMIDGGATLAIDGKSVTTPTITFSGPSATLELAKGAMVLSEIDGFAAGDSIEMAGVSAARWNAATHLLTLSGGGTTVDRLHLGGTFSADAFTVSQANGVGVITLHS